METSTTQSRKLPKGRPKRSFAYWEGATDPGHRHQDAWWTAFYANELLLYFPLGRSHVLDLGCGTGTFYSYLKDHCLSYVGADFSESMLQEFRMAHPDVTLLHADASQLEIDGTVLRRGSFDMIFSNQVCQFFDKTKMRRHLQSLADLTRPGGVCLMGNVPDAQLRFHYYFDALRADRPFSWVKGMRRTLSTLLKRGDGIGYWYTRAGLAKMAGEFGFECESFSSASFEFRFHLRLVKK